MADQSYDPGCLDRCTASLVYENSVELTSLAGNLLNAAKGEEVRTILVTSAHPGEGKTTASISIACALANQVQSRVALLDANFQHPRLHELYHVDRSPGLTDLLAREQSLGTVLRQTELEKLRLVPAGSPMNGQVGRHGARTLRETLDELKKDHDYVIVDSCHFFDSSDVSLFARMFDGIIMVIECEKTKWEVVQQVVESLRNVGGRMLGSVLNKRHYYIPRQLYGKV